MSRNGEAQEYGELAEQWVCDIYRLAYHDEDFWDAMSAGGRKVQIKGAMKWVKNGYRDGKQQRCRGRFKFWERDHYQLEEDDGVYILLLYEDADHGIKPVNSEMVDPEEVADVVDGDWYTENDIRESAKGQVYRASWPHFMGGFDD